MSCLITLALANIILLVSLMLFLIYVAYGHHNYHFIQAQDDVIFLETFEGALKVGNGTAPQPIPHPIPQPNPELLDIFEI